MPEVPEEEEIERIEREFPVTWESKFKIFEVNVVKLFERMKMLERYGYALMWVVPDRVFKLAKPPIAYLYSGIKRGMRTVRTRAPVGFLRR